MKKTMNIGDVVVTKDVSYEIRGIVDSRYVVRVCNERCETDKYEVWTFEEFTLLIETVDRNSDFADRNCQIHERSLAGETNKDLAKEFHLSSARIREICAMQARKEGGRKSHRS